MVIHIQRGNAKLPKFILNFSLPPVLTCPHSTENCKKYCYANKFYRMWPSVKKAWDENLKESATKTFVKDTIEELKKEKEWTICRIHVSGDFYDKSYYHKWIKIIKEFPDKQFYAYSKNPVYKFFDKRKKPDNLIMIYSCPINDWNHACDNHYFYNGFSIVLDKTDKILKQKPKDWIICKGDCKICSYCYTKTNFTKKIIFLKH